jgi:SAM-dependent methyltransferase
MAQNIYDRAEFFENYARLPRSERGLLGAPEWPSLQRWLPDLQDLDVVDLGCGFGWFCRWARERGAASVLGVDLSENMLARARSLTTDGAITYRRADLERLTLPERRFGLAYSSLALHYIEALPELFGILRRALLPEARFVFSVEHPMYTAPAHPGWVLDAHQRESWGVNQYAVEGPRTTDWLAPGVIKQHRRLATYVNLLIASGFQIAALEEWSPSDEQLAAAPQLAPERERPTFLLVSARVA